MFRAAALTAWSRTRSTGTCTRCWPSGSTWSGCRRFAITRLDSVEDVYLFHGVAHDNPKDERLFALAEVRDLTAGPRRDGTGGRVPAARADPDGDAVGHPAVPVPPSAGAAAAREHGDAATSGRRGRCRSSIWRDLAHKLAPATSGLGIERVVARVRIADGGRGPAGGRRST